MESIQPEVVLYEDNHLVIVNKQAGENVQGDSSGDQPLVEKVREYIRIKFEKPGNVFCGLFTAWTDLLVVSSLLREPVRRWNA